MMAPLASGRGEHVWNRGTHKPAGLGAIALALLTSAGAWALTVAFGHATMQTAQLETTKLRLGLPVHASEFLPVYLAADRTARDERLTIEVTAFMGEAPLLQALASNSVEIAVLSLNGVINLRRAGQRVTGFYAGISQADFEWFSRPEIGRWTDMKGRSAGIGSHGSLTDFLTRYVLRRHGLQPEKDVVWCRSVARRPRSRRSGPAGWTW